MPSRKRAGRRTVQLIALATASLTLPACSDLSAKTDPPKIVQLTCKPQPDGPLMILVIDTGLRRVTWMNAFDGLRGEVAITEREYRLHFPNTAKTHESVAVINRYDGVMTREFGSPPFLQADGDVKIGNVTQTWACSPQKTGPRL